VVVIVKWLWMKMFYVKVKSDKRGNIVLGRHLIDKTLDTQRKGLGIFGVGLIK